MTISYSAEVPNGSNFGCFWKILWKWRGSVYKLIWRELLAYLCVYYTINFMYRYGLNEDQRRIFERIRSYFGEQRENVPLSFVLGFYVSLVVKRWWEQYRLLPWPDTLALFISAAIPGNDETGRLMRRNIMRYCILSYVITLQKISLRVKRRFPGWQHLVDAGLMLDSEKKIFEIMDGKSPMSKYWMPLVWATNIINRARKDNFIVSDHLVQTLLMELSDIRRRLGGLIGYDTVCVPLVYTQVVTLVLYSYFIAAIMGSQMIPTYNKMTKEYEELDVYFPLFTALQFVFYVGWLKVAEVLINPFGEDDDDIELNWLIDRHIKASYMIVDEMHNEHPELLKDQYWEEVVPKDLPYTVASEHYRKEEPKGSAEQYKIKESDALYANIIPSGKRHVNNDEVYADYESVDTPMAERRKGWFSRQITRMGSARSSSTAYSSGGIFGRNRHNSVYSSPEAGLTTPITAPAQKMNLYEKFIGRKSGRIPKQIIKQNSKISLNGAVISTVPPKNRPRIPTPEVANEANRTRQINVTTVSGHTPNISSGVALVAQQLAQNPSIYPNTDLSVVGTLLLSPIKELDSSSSNNTLHAGHSATAALAKSILPSNLKNSVTDPSNLELAFGNSSTSNSLGANTLIVLPTTSTSQLDNSRDLLPISITSIPLSISVTPVTSTSTTTATRITELPFNDKEPSTATINELPSGPKSDAPSSAASTLSNRKHKHGEVYV